MSVNDVVKLAIKAVMIALIFAISIYPGSYLLTLSFYCIGVIVLLKDTTNGLAMLFGGISGLIGQILRGDNSLLFIAFASFAYLGFINNYLRSKKGNYIIGISVVAVISCVLNITIVYVLYDRSIVSSIFTTKLIELLIVIVVSTIIETVIQKLENR